jgi:hypothetical protein
MKEEAQSLLKRLDLVKDCDPFNKKLLNDCFDSTVKLLQEIERLQYHNNNLMNVIYQNQHELENVYESAGTEQKL